MLPVFLKLAGIKLFLKIRIVMTWKALVRDAVMALVFYLVDPVDIVFKGEILQIHVEEYIQILRLNRNGFHVCRFDRFSLI